MKNFFEHQDQARQKTTYLIFLFSCSVAATVLALYIALLMVEGSLFPLWRPMHFAGASAIVLVTVGVGSVWKMGQLRGGGAAIANSLGGQPVSINTQSPQEKELLNVVTEMAIAAGTAMPKVYILPDTSINAFAAGFDPNDSVIGVTQGTLTQLTRDELQAVIGHEFSHIVNGDMGLNLKLIGWVHGLLCLYIVGREIVFRGSRGRKRTSSGGKKGMDPILALALTMMVLGIIGWIFGQLIKSAISKQREFLADAASVQFTRDANSLANALRRIATASPISKIAAPQAASASHLFFNETSSISSFISAFSTHPPLAERIRRLGGGTLKTPLPSKQEKLSKQIASQVSEVAGLSALNTKGSAEKAAMLNQLNATAASHQAQQPASAPPRQIVPKKVLNTIGTVTPATLNQAKTLLSGLPQALLETVRSQSGAVAVVYGLLLDKDPAIRTQQTEMVAESSQTVAKLLAKLEPLLSQVDVRSRLPLLELCIPALKTLKPDVAAQFFTCIKALVRADGKLSLSEFGLQAVLQYRLAPHFRPTPPPGANITHLSEVWPECQLLIAALAKAGHANLTDANYTFRNGLSHLPLKGCSLPADTPKCTLPDLSRALQKLRLTIPKLKQVIANACAHTVLTDGLTTDREAELLRAVLITLGCPIPPFIDPGSTSTVSREAA